MALNEENHPFEYNRPSFNMLSSNSEFNPSTTLTNFDFGSGANIALSMPPAPKSPSKDMAQPQESINPIEKPQKSEAGPSSSDLGSIQPPQPLHEAAPQQSFISHGQDGTTFSFPPASTSGQNLSPLGGSPSAVSHSAPQPDGTHYGLPHHTLDAPFSDNNLLHNFPGLEAHANHVAQHSMGVNMASISHHMGAAQENHNNNLPNGAHSHPNQSATSSTLVPVPQHSGPNYTDITEYLNMPQNEAAKRLQIPTSTLSKRWKEAVVNRKWPYRTVCKIDKEIMTLLHNIPQGPGAPPLPAEIEQSLAMLLKRRQAELRTVILRL